MRFSKRLPRDTATLLQVTVFIIVLLGLSLAAHDPASHHVKAISAVGAESDNTRILTTAYEPIPPGTAFSVKTADNADLTMQVAEQMRRQLQKDGYVVSGDSPLVLMIGTAAPASLDDDMDLPMKLTGGTRGLGMRFKLIGANSSGLLQESPEPVTEDYQIVLSV